MEETSTVQKRQVFRFHSEQFYRCTVKVLREQEHSSLTEFDRL